MTSSDVQREAIPAPWRRFTNADEDQRLSTIEDRIARREALLKWDTKEKKRIMARAIHRMRRAEGKT